jgi:hypothetical protein
MECIMERDTEQHELIELVELGAASEQTLGGEGYSIDLVREIPKTGISDE